MDQGYEYIERHVAPNTVEFYVRTSQGHRVVRIILDGKDPRVQAFNESSGKRSPALLFMSELERLIKRAKILTGVK